MHAINSATEIAMAEAGLVPGQSPSPLRLPDFARIFGLRAERLHQLVPGSSLNEWIAFIASLSEAQQKVAEQNHEAAATPEEQWRQDLRAILDALLANHLPLPILTAVNILSTAGDNVLLPLAERLEAGQAEAGDLQLAPFIVAAQQVAWTRHAASLNAEDIHAPATAHTCPVCGSAPVAGIHHVGKASGLRYLHCGQCNTAWHHVRAACVACGDGSNVSYRFIESQDGPARAETCDHCHSYLKLLLADKAPGVDAVADDLASLGLDLLVGEEGYQRIGINPFLLQGE